MLIFIIIWLCLLSLFVCIESKVSEKKTKELDVAIGVVDNKHHTYVNRNEQFRIMLEEYLKIESTTITQKPEITKYIKKGDCTCVKFYDIVSKPKGFYLKPKNNKKCKIHGGKV